MAQVGLVEAESSRQLTQGVLVGHMVRLPAWVHQNAQNDVRSGGHHAHFEVVARSLPGGRSLFFFPRKNFEVVAAWSFFPGKHFEVVAGLTQPPSWLLIFVAVAGWVVSILTPGDPSGDPESGLGILAAKIA